MARKRRPTRPTIPFRFLGLRTATFLLLGCLVWLLLNIGSLRQFIRAYQDRNRERDKVEEVERRVAVLSREKLSLELGLFENEKSVREAYRLVRPGERLIVLSPEDEKSTATGKTTQSTDH
jgi:hypothetical protein